MRSTGSVEWTALRPTLLVLISGTVFVGVRGHAEDVAGGTRLGEGRIGLISEGTAFTLRSEGTVEMLGLTLDPVYVQVVSGGQIPAAGLGLETRIGVVDGVLAVLVPALHRELLAVGGGGSPYSEALAASIALRMAMAYRSVESGGGLDSRGKPVPFLVRKAMTYMNERIAEEISLEALARHVGQSPFHFARAFKEAVGYAPHQYLIRQRIERAKQMLVVGRHSPAEVADKVGFCDQSHLTRHFKRITGTTPSQFLRVTSGRGRFTRREA